MSLDDLKNSYAQDGTVTWMGVRPSRKVPMIGLNEVLAIQNKGLEGDRFSAFGADRQVTLIQEEHLKSVASFLAKSSINPALTRRNIVVKGINLLGLKEKKFSIGDAVFEYSGECHPCSRMEENLGLGGFNAMRGHGGITAKVIEGGVIKIGDQVSVYLTKESN